jgi:hypothetical protein
MPAKVTETSERTVRREVIEFDEPYGELSAETWTRYSSDGRLDQWVPHDGYGEMMPSCRATGDLRKTLEQKYQEEC